MSRHSKFKRRWFFDLSSMNLTVAQSASSLKPAAAPRVSLKSERGVPQLAKKLNQALLQALGDRKGINRFGHFSAPPDKAAIEVIPGGEWTQVFYRVGRSLKKVKKLLLFVLILKHFSATSLHFTLGSTDHRGMPAFPGITVTLEPCPGEIYETGTEGGKAQLHFEEILKRNIAIYVVRVLFG